MSFSSNVKEELIKSIPHDRHCRLCELTAILAFAGKRSGSSIFVYQSSETKGAIRKCFTLLNKTFNINTDVLGEGIDNGRTFIEFGRKTPGMSAVLDAIANEAPGYLLSNDCCKRAYLRGTFISVGFVGDPGKSYHLEFVCQDEDSAVMLKELLYDFDIEAKSTKRRKYYVVYIKDADTIQDVLNVLDAHNSLMEFVNARILKDVRNDLNRRNNCDIGNISRAVNAGSKQIDDISLIEEKVGLDALPAQLREIAKLRLDNPESSLTELGEMLDPKVGKSGVNHRLRKIGEFAENLRQQ